MKGFPGNKVRLLLAVLVLAVVGFVLVIQVQRSAPPLIEGIIWQPTNDYPQPQGHWQLLGADTLVVQWSLNNNQAWLPSSQFRSQPELPDWDAVREAPWASRLLLGLASRMHLDDARRDWRLLRRQNVLLAEEVGFPVDGWYAPIEFSPDWRDEEAYRHYLDSLPRPRYVSAYGGYELSPEAFANWVDGWLPSDAVLLYQDGVGVGRQTPRQARARANALMATLGEERVIMVLEAFRNQGERFGPASLSQLIGQLRAYRGLRIYVFAARHFSTAQVLALRLLAPWLATDE